MNSVLHVALSEYKQAMANMVKNHDPSQRKRPMAEITQQGKAKFLSLRTKSPKDYEAFLELARKYDKAQQEKNAEMAKIETERAEALIKGVPKKDLDTFMKEINKAIGTRDRNEAKIPEIVAGKFASAFIKALMRTDGKISPALPVTQIEIADLVTR